MTQTFDHIVACGGPAGRPRAARIAAALLGPARACTAGQTGDDLRLRAPRGPARLPRDARRNRHRGSARAIRPQKRDGARRPSAGAVAHPAEIAARVTVRTRAGMTVEADGRDAP